MVGIGTLVNSGAIVIGGVIGLMAGRFLSDAVKQTLLHVLGLACIYVAVDMMLKGKNWLLPAVACLLIGSIIGAIFNLEGKFTALTSKLHQRFSKNSSQQDRFTEGFVTASLLFCIGAMGIIGSIQDASHDPHLLYVKALLDFFAAMTLSASLGSGVAISAISVFIYQGTITLLASQLNYFTQNPHLLVAINATGCMLILAIGINLLELGKNRIAIGNFLPAVLLSLTVPIWI